MICFVAFFGVALGLGAWLPNMMATTHGFTINKSLAYTVGMTLAFPCASGFMMYALDRFGRKITAVAAFVLAGPRRRGVRRGDRRTRCSSWSGS